MFTKKKSLAKIAQLRSKESSPSGSLNAKGAIEDDDQTRSEEEEEDHSSTSPQSSSWDQKSGHLAPLHRKNSASTPNLMKKPSKMTRNISLKYSGALHSCSHSPQEFDHNFDDSSGRLHMVQEKNESEMRWWILKNRLGEASGSHALRRTQSVQGPPIVRLCDESGAEIEESLQCNGNTILGSASYSPVSSSYVNQVIPNQKNPPIPRRTSSQIDYPKEKDNGRLPGNKTVDLRRESVAKSQSMTSLSSDSEQLGQSLTISALQARTRSFLLGSVGATSLLGPLELEKCFSDRTLRLFIGSWNMNGKTPPRHLADFLLPKNLEYVPDILVIGTQECFPERNEWEVRLQDTLGPSHVLFHSAGLGTLHQAVYLRRDLIWYCSIPETDSFNSRPGTQFRTKGAVATSFLLFGTSFLFVNCHLTAHQENTKDRIKDFKKINAMLNLPRELPSRGPKHRDVSDKFDCVFWSGDLNFRLEQSREVVIREVQDGASVLEFDQLNYLRQEGLIFKGYIESEITFPPTYKYDVGTNEFDTSSKLRTPAYTDRILYKSNKSTKVNAIYYDSVQDILTSDHKPVWGIWEVTIRPGRDTIPLAGGTFNRDVYIDGLKRRAAALQPILAGKNGAMCSLQ